MPLFKNIIILYPPGAGGNHLANMISTHDAVAKRAQVDDYISYLLEAYSTTGENNSHFSKLDPTVNDKSINSIIANCSKALTNVLCCHAHQYYLATDRLNSLEDMCIITIDVQMNSALYRRIERTMPRYFAMTYDASVAYKEQVVAALSGLTYDRIFTFSDAWLADKNGTEISKFMQTYLGIQLPEVAFDIHKIWVERQLHGK